MSATGGKPGHVADSIPRPKPSTPMPSDGLTVALVPSTSLVPVHRLERRLLHQVLQ